MNKFIIIILTFIINYTCGNWAVATGYSSSETNFDSGTWTILSFSDLTTNDFVDLTTDGAASNNVLNFTVAGNYSFDYSLVWGATSSFSGASVEFYVYINGNNYLYSSAYYAAGTGQTTTSSRSFVHSISVGDKITTALDCASISNTKCRITSGQAHWHGLMISIVRV